MEYRHHKLIKRIISDSSKTFPPCLPDILSVNPYNIPQYARLVSRYQDLIKHYDKLNDLQQKNVQVSINAITRQLTLLLKQNPDHNDNPAKAIFLLGLIGNVEKQMTERVLQAARPVEMALQ